MPLAERLGSPRAAKRPCAVGRLLPRLSDRDRAALVAALADREGLTTSDILRDLRAEGHEVGHTTVLRHRKGECCCESR